ncbi:MAG: DUF401 family protein [Pseudomonadales bacterium]
MELLLHNQSYLLYLIGVMMVSGMIRDQQLFAGLYTLLLRRIKSKRLLMALVALLCGVLPIPGRVTFSAGMLDTLVARKAPCRSKIGLIDYLSTHHYYLWSPLEKTVIIPMAVLGLSYGQFLVYSLPLLVVSLCFIAGYLFVYVKERDIDLQLAETAPVQAAALWMNTIPLLLAVAAMIYGFHPAMVFPGLVIYYHVRSNNRDHRHLLTYVNLRLVLFLALVIIAGNVIAQHDEAIKSILSTYQLQMDQPDGVMIISLFAFGSGYVLGSSSKFAGLVALLSSLYGLEYLTFFLALEFSGYLLSPVHKCVWIGKMYFGTPLSHYFYTLSTWCVLIVAYGVVASF